MCGSVMPPRTRCHRVVVETRPKIYPRREKVFQVLRWERGRWRLKDEDDPGGVGYETVREVIACPRCAAAARPDM
jgi:hypothetical protein